MRMLQNNKKIKKKNNNNKEIKLNNSHFRIQFK